MRISTGTAMDPRYFWLGGTALGVLSILARQASTARTVRIAAPYSVEGQLAGSKLPEAKSGIDLQQVWFAGVHADVGGGSADRGLGDIAATSMMREAQSFGLQFEPHPTSALKHDFKAPQHNEYKGVYRLCGKPSVRPVTGPVHETVKLRCEKNVNDYQKRSPALTQALDQAGGNWAEIRTVN